MLLSVFIVGGAWAFNIPDADLSITSETAVSPGQALVTILAKPTSARFSIDKGSFLSSGWKGSLVPGTHTITVSADDHYPSQFAFNVQQNTKYIITVTLEPHTGFLAMTIFPTDASVYVDGAKVEGPIIEIPAGRYSVSVRKFGYNEAKVPVSIFWQRTSTLNIALSPSVFEISSFHLSPKAFNPANKGAYNRAALSFSVTAPGFGQVEILNAAGLLVRKDELPVFRSWSQRYVWRGTDEDEKTLPDGEYEVKVSIWPLSLEKEASPFESRPGSQSSTLQSPQLLPEQTTPIPSYGPLPPAATAPTPESALSKSATVLIDSSRNIMVSGTSAVRPGLLYFADPKVRELLPGSAEIVGGYPSNASLSLGFKIGESTMLSAEGLWDIEFGGGVAGSVLRTVAGFGDTDIALLGRVSWTGAAASSYPGSASEAEISLPVAIDAGSLRAGLAPGFVYDMKEEGMAGRLSAGLWYESQGLSAGLSALQDIGSVGLMNPANPLFFAAEARILFETQPFTMLLRISGALEPELAYPAASLGFGVAW